MTSVRHGVGVLGPVVDRVREVNGGRALWFVADDAELDGRLAALGRRQGGRAPSEGPDDDDDGRNAGPPHGVGGAADPVRGQDQVARQPRTRT